MVFPRAPAHEEDASRIRLAGARAGRILDGARGDAGAGERPGGQDDSGLLSEIKRRFSAPS
jgi:hypothetical protein